MERIRIFQVFLLLLLLGTSPHVQASSSSAIHFDESSEFGDRGTFPKKMTRQRQRVLTDVEYLQNGAELNYSYNQTRTYNWEVVSAPGCPNAVEGRPWVHYGNPKRCYLVGFEGPCSWGKRIFAYANSPDGLCNCDCFSGPSPIPLTDYRENEIYNDYSSPSSTPLVFGRIFQTFLSNAILPLQRRQRDVDGNGENKKLGLARYKFCFSHAIQRLTVFDFWDSKCYPVLDRGPCAKDEWLVKDMVKENSVICEKRKCPEYYNKGDSHSGGGYTYFDSRKQECLSEVYGSLRESFFTQSGGILSRTNFCREAGMKYSQRLKTCVKDLSSKLKFRVSQIG